MPVRSSGLVFRDLHGVHASVIDSQTPVQMRSSNAAGGAYFTNFGPGFYRLTRAHPHFRKMRI